MPKVKANGIEINYEVIGFGEPLVLISGLGYPLWQWHKMAPHLAAHFTVITFDNRGVGKSDKPAGPYTAQMLAADTASLLDELVIENAIILGHSMGGFVAQAMALEYPAKVSQLILCSTNFGGPHSVPITQEAMAVLSDVTSDPLTRFKNGLKVSTAPGWTDANPLEVQAWVDWRLANPLDLAGYQSQLAIGLALISEEAAFENKLTDISVPTLVMFGAHDKVVPPANAELLAARIPNSQVAVLAEAGHFFPIEAAEEAAHVIIDFAKQEVVN